MPKRMIFLILVAELLLLPSQRGNAQDEISDLNEKIDNFILLEIGKKFGGTLQNVQKKLGEALNIIEKKTENIHVPGVEETVIEVHYSGITFVFLKENDVHREFLVETELRGKDFDLSWGVRIGITREKLIEIFGEPRRRLENRSVFCYEDFESLNRVDFYFKEDSLYKIQWIFYVD